MYEDLLDNIVRDLESKTNDDAAIVVATLFNRTTNCFETSVLVTAMDLIEHVPHMLREVAANMPREVSANIPRPDNPVNIDGIIHLCRTVC